MIHFEDTPKLLRDKGRRWRAAMESLWQRVLVLFVRAPDAPVAVPAPQPPPLIQPEPEPTIFETTYEAGRIIDTPQQPELSPMTPAPEPEPERKREPEPASPGLNRHDRRRMEKWERERRKHDVLVMPAIPPEIPPRRPRAKTSAPRPKPEPNPADAVREQRTLIDGEDGKIYHERELYGEFTFRDTILEQLELYWIYLRRMQQRDRDSYEFYKRIGATITPPISRFLHDGIRPKNEKDKHEKYDEPITLTSWWRENRPAFGCVAYGITKKIEQQEAAKPYKGDKSLWVPKFFYFVKYKQPPPTIAHMSGGDTYKLTIWWDRPFDPKYNLKKGGAPTECALFLDREHIKVLPLLDTKMVDVPTKKNGLDIFSIPQRAWRIPEFWKEWAADNDEQTDHLIARMFMDTARSYEQSNWGMIRVAVHNGDLTAQFVVDPRRMSYFFQDRDIVYTPRGAREAVFHIVRAHERQGVHGPVAIRLHFRGAKEFTWAGYRVTVTVPDRDHRALSDLDIGVSDMYWVPRKERKSWIDEKEFGERLKRYIEGERDAIANELPPPA